MTTTNAIVALEAGNNASHIIIPIKVDGYAIAGLSQTIDTINRTARSVVAFHSTGRFCRR